MHNDPLFLQAYMNMQNFNFESDSTATDVTFPNSFHLSSPLAHCSLYLDVFDEAATLEVNFNSLYIYLAGFDYNQVQDVEVSQLDDEKIESIVHDLFNCQNFIGREEDDKYVQGIPLTDSSGLFTHEEFHMINLKSDQLSRINNFFGNTFDDSGAYLPVDLSKPPKSDDPSYENLGTCQGIEAL